MNPADTDCVVQAGVTREQLNSYLRDTGLFFPVDPGANATLGGMVSTRASGTTTIRYGAMTRNVLALQVVLADGRIVRVGTRAAKSSSGYDLVRLLVGSEGTLGVITEITLRLYGIPETTVGATCVFPALRGAVDAVVEIIQSGASVSRIEFLDELQVRACNRYSQLSMPEQPTLFLEFSGAAESVDGQVARARRNRTVERRLSVPMGGGRTPNAHDCGKRVTRLTSPRWHCGRAASASSQTSAYRFRSSPMRSRTHGAISTPLACSRRSSVTSATAISTCCSCSNPA